jgi:tetratricopeptide (TPR) repeat protein
LEAEKADPDNFQYPFQVGNSQFMLGKYDDAILAYDRSLKLKPDFKQAINNRGLAIKKKAGG